MRASSFKINALVFFAVLFLSPLFYGPVLAAPKIRIKPMVTVSGRLESNFYLTENNERDVYTFLFQPGIQLGMEMLDLSRECIPRPGSIRRKYLHSSLSGCFCHIDKRWPYICVM